MHKTGTIAMDEETLILAQTSFSFQFYACDKTKLGQFLCYVVKRYNVRCKVEIERASEKPLSHSRTVFFLGLGYSLMLVIVTHDN